MTSDEDPAVLRRALDQLADLLDDVPSGALADPTPCPSWNVQDLVAHIVPPPSRFPGSAGGGAAAWSETPAPAGDAAFHSPPQGEDFLGAFPDPAAPGSP